MPKLEELMTVVEREEKCFVICQKCQQTLMPWKPNLTIPEVEKLLAQHKHKERGGNYA